MDLEVLTRHPWEGFSDNGDRLAVRLEIRADGTGETAILRSISDPLVDLADRRAGVPPRETPRTATRWRVDRVDVDRRGFSLRMTREQDGEERIARGVAVRVANGAPPALLICLDPLPTIGRCNFVRLHPEPRMSGRLKALELALAPP